MASELAGQCAIITGAGAGIGLCFAKLLLQKGCSVVIADLKLTSEAESLLSQYPHSNNQTTATNSKPSAVFQKTDVVSWPQLTLLWERATELHNRVDIVVPGAGVFEPSWSSFWSPPRSSTNPDSPSLDKADAEPGRYGIIDLNLVAPIRLSQMAIGHWTSNKQKGCLVLVGSIAGYVDTPIRPLYHTTKHGIHGFVSCMGPLRDKLGIRVSAVAPGPVETTIWNQGFAMTQEMKANMSWVDIQDVARTMYELVVNKELGDGTILEVLASGTRVLPRFPGASKEVLTLTVEGYVKAQDAFLDVIQENGLKV
ncbi:hypothetical protein QQS21_010025 [Conoideocrella luteorostrata]|uniref:Uncharacterized protein n=1 Tax=Conoideocrella luteorostrata TaxID=1105319 RepID=A0AAJ0FPT6_9HYPO|nr:hypothetical protein QQS21_010025 [Conoideocrella luteorostrata]